MIYLLNPLFELLIKIIIKLLRGSFAIIVFLFSYFLLNFAQLFFILYNFRSENIEYKLFNPVFFYNELFKKMFYELL